MGNNERGVAVNEVMRELALRNHLRKLAAQRDRRATQKKKKEACTGGAVQTSNVNMQENLRNNDITKDAVCQGGGVLA